MKKFGLSVAEKIKGRKDFEELFSKGSTLFSPSKKIKAIYIIDKCSGMPGIKVAVAVSRKSGNAVWRNRVKRLLRESYRLNKQSLLDKTKDTGSYIRIIFSPCSLNMRNNKNIYLREIMPDIIDLMSGISSRL